MVNGLLAVEDGIQNSSRNGTTLRNKIQK
jgi:hypothetical protein